MMLIEPPQNGQYLAAAYVIAATILIGYWVMLWRKARHVSGNSKKRKR